MNVVFIVPPERHFIESYVTKKLDKAREFRQKLGIMYVAGALRESTGIVPTIIDCLAEGYDLDDLMRVIKQLQPDLVGFSVVTFNLLDCLDAARAVKSVCPEARICFGGFHVSIYPQETLALDNVDFVVFGEGEITFPELVRVLREHANHPPASALCAIAGIGYHDEQGRAVVNEPRKPIGNLDSLPMPAHDLVDIGKYTFVLAEDCGVGAIQTSRGCPGRCVFCDMRLTRYRYRSEDHVLREIKLLKDMGVNEFFFIDDTFTINRKRVRRLCKLLVSENLRIRYKISARIDRIDEEMLRALARSGCYRIHYGIESGSQRILDYLQKEVTVRQIEEVVAMTKAAGIEVLAYLMLGTPTETHEDMQETFDLVDRIKPDHVNYSICTPFPGTLLYRQMLADHNSREDYWHNFAIRPDPGFKIRTMNDLYDEVELRRFQDNALRRFYSSPRVIIKELVRTRSAKQLWVKARMGSRLLLPRLSHSRMFRKIPLTKLKVLGNIANHPATRGDLIGSLSRAIFWEAYKRSTATPLTVRLVGGLRVHCEREKNGSHVAITYRGLYDYHDMLLLRRYLRPGDNVADIGANIGLCSLMISRLIAPTGRLDAFEALPSTAAALRRNIELNGISNITVHECALGDQAGTITFSAGADDLTNHILPDHQPGSGERAVEVPCYRLQDVAGGTAFAAAHLDVEGAEPLVLSGAEDMLKQGNPPVLIIELNGRLHAYGWQEAQLVDWLMERGYRVGVYDADANSFDFVSPGGGAKIINMMGGRDNVVAVWQEALDDVVARINEHRATMDGAVNTRSSQSWP